LAKDHDPPRPEGLVDVLRQGLTLKVVGERDSENVIADLSEDRVGRPGANLREPPLLINWSSRNAHRRGKSAKDRYNALTGQASGAVNRLFAQGLVVAHRKLDSVSRIAHRKRRLDVMGGQNAAVLLCPLTARIPGQFH